MSEDRRIYEDDCYIKSKKHNCNIEQFQESYPNGASDRIIANSLGVSELEVDNILKSAILKLKELFKG